MSKLAQLREQRNIKAKAANDINDKFPADQRMPAAESERLDAVLAEIEAIDGEITRETRLAQLAGEQAENLLDRAREVATREPSKHGPESSALRAYMQGGIAGLSAEQRSAMVARQNDDVRQAMNPMTIRGAMSTTTPAEGGYTTAPEYMRTVETAMRAYGAMLGLADIMRTSTGNQIPWPTNDPTSEIGEIVGQNTQTGTLDTTFGLVPIDVYKYSSKAIALPWELIQDSFIDMEALIQEILGTRLGRIIGQHTTTGTGTGQPKGVVTAATIGKTGATGSTTSVGYDDFVALEHSVDPAYRNAPGVGYQMHDQTLAVVRKIKDGQNRPIFVPGYEANALVNGGAPDRLMGRPIYINQDMAQMAANAKSILFGAYKKYKLRQVMDLTMFRMTDSAFTLKGQIGFVAFQRMGGNSVDPGGAIKAYQNSAT